MAPKHDTPSGGRLLGFSLSGFESPELVKVFIEKTLPGRVGGSLLVDGAAFPTNEGVRCALRGTTVRVEVELPRLHRERAAAVVTRKVGEVFVAATLVDAAGVLITTTGTPALVSSEVVVQLVVELDGEALVSLEDPLGLVGVQVVGLASVVAGRMA
jgi:hypothetical protein